MTNILILAGLLAVGILLLSVEGQKRRLEALEKRFDRAEETAGAGRRPEGPDECARRLEELWSRGLEGIMAYSIDDAMGRRKGEN